MKDKTKVRHSGDGKPSVPPNTVATNPDQTNPKASIYPVAVQETVTDLPPAVPRPTSQLVSTTAADLTSKIPASTPLLSTTAASERSTDIHSTSSVQHRRIIRNLWQVCCTEVGVEVAELNGILTKVGLAPVNYSKDKTYDLTDYDVAPDMENCKSKDFLDFYVFPVLLPAIQSLVQFAISNRVLQCQYCSFNSMDYIVEYLHNNNPRYPERQTNPIPLFDISFVKSWLAKYPRPPLPKWLTLTTDQAALTIQRSVRGFLVRIRPEVQEMRQFWKDYKKDLEEDFMNVEAATPKLSDRLFSPYYSELFGEFDDHTIDEDSRLTHSDNCGVCIRFREFIHAQEILQKQKAELSTGSSDPYEDDLEDQENLELLRTPTATGINAAKLSVDPLHRSKISSIASSSGSKRATKHT